MRHVLCLAALGERVASKSFLKFEERLRIFTFICERKSFVIQLAYYKLRR